MSDKAERESLRSQHLQARMMRFLAPLPLLLRPPLPSPTPRPPPNPHRQGFSLLEKLKDLRKKDLQILRSRSHQFKWPGPCTKTFQWSPLDNKFLNINRKLKLHHLFEKSSTIKIRDQNKLIGRVNTKEKVRRAQEDSKIIQFRFSKQTRKYCIHEIKTVLFYFLLPF